MPKATLTFAMRLFRVALPLALLCLIALTRVALTWRVYTPTFDEPAHIAAGMEWLDRGAYRYEEMHPPLARVADALGPWVAGLHSEGQAGIRREGNAILNQRGDQACRNVTDLAPPRRGRSSRTRPPTAATCAPATCSARARFPAPRRTPSAR